MSDGGAAGRRRASSPPLDTLQSASFDQSPFATLITSSEGQICAANRAARFSFQLPSRPQTCHISSLPLKILVSPGITSTSGLDATLDSFVRNTGLSTVYDARNSGQENHSDSSLDEHTSAVDAVWDEDLEGVLVDNKSKTTQGSRGAKSYRVTLSPCAINDALYVVFTFVKVSTIEVDKLAFADMGLVSKTVADGVAHQTMHPDAQSPSRLWSSNMLPTQPQVVTPVKTRLDARLDDWFLSLGKSQAPSTTVPHAILEAQITKLKEAVYFRAGRPGFILSADGRIGIAKFSENGSVAPIIVENLTTFLACWDLWDSHFTRRIPVDEFPVNVVNRTQKGFENERYGLLSNTGAKIVLEITGEPLLDSATREHIGVVVWLHDLGTVEELEAREKAADLKSFKTVCESLPHQIFTLSADGTPDYFSQSWHTFTGLDRAVSVADMWKRALHPDDLEKLLRVVHRAVKSGRDWEVEIRVRRQDGKYVWTVAKACALTEHGTILKFYGTITNVDDIVSARLLSDKVRAQQMAVLAGADVLLYTINRDWTMGALSGTISWTHATDNTNDKAQLKHADLRVYLASVEEDGCIDFVNAAESVMTGKQSSTMIEWAMANKWLRAHLVADMEGSTIVGVLGCTIDQTQSRARMKLETENARLQFSQKNAQESNRLKSQFLANMSHEIRTPIAGIMGMAGLLQTDTTLDTQQDEYVEGIQTSAKNLLTVINDILDFSKIEAGKLQVETVAFSLRNLVEDVFRLFLPTARDNPNVTFTQNITNAPDTKLMGDPGRIRQILLNLLSNAWKFTIEGAVELSTRCESTDDAVSVFFVVADSGIGISKEVQALLFTPFSQGDASTARQYGGTGLGLTISRDLAQLMGGTLELDSTAGVGTKATFTLKAQLAPPQIEFETSTTSGQNPHSDKHTFQAAKVRQKASNYQGAEKTLCDQPQSGQSETDSEKGPSVLPHNLAATERSRPHILIVEDNSINQRIAVMTVRSLNCTAAAVSNGQEALDYLLNSPGGAKTDLVLMDCQMPVMDGYEATRVIRKLGQNSGVHDRFKELPIIALTASAIQGDREKCLDSGMTHYLSKPFSKGDLAEAVAKWTVNRNAG